MFLSIRQMAVLLHEELGEVTGELSALLDHPLGRLGSFP